MYLIDYLYDKRINKKEFCKLIGVSERTLWNILRGEDTKNSIAIKILIETSGKVTNTELAKPRDKIKDRCQDENT